MRQLKNYQIVFLSYYYPPIKSPGVFRSYHLSHLLKDSFQNTSVLTTSNRRIMENDAQPIDADIQVIENYTFDYRYLSFLILKNNERREAKVKKRTGGKLFLKAMRSFPFNLLIGEGAFFYIFNTYRKAKSIIRQNPDTVLFSSFSPYADHVVAWLLKRKYPKLIWIADFRDLHVDPIFKNYLFPKLQYWVNKKIVPNADFVTTVSEGLALKIKDLHGDVMVLPNGVRKIPAKEEKSKKHFVINYTGSMFRDLWKPQILFEAIEHLVEDGKISKNDIKINQAGRDANMWDQALENYDLYDNVHFNHVVPHRESIRFQSKAHVNLLLTVSQENHKGILTSKIFEYLAAGNPILVIINGPRDEIFERAFIGIDHVLITYHRGNQQKVKDFIFNLYSKWKNKETYPSIPQSSWKNRYYWPEMVKPLINKIQSTVTS